MATPDDIIEAQRIANARRMAQAAVAPVTAPAVDPYYVRDPKTGLSPAQMEANKVVAEAAATANKQVVPGDAGESNRVLTPYEKGNTTYLGKEYATAAGAYTAAVKAAEKAGPPGPAPAGLHWNLQGTEWKLYDAEGKPFNYIGTSTEDFTGDGTAGSPLLYKGKPFNGTRGGITYVNGVPKGASSGGGAGASGGAGSGGTGGGGKTVTGTYTDPATGDVYLVYSDGSRTLQAKGTKASDAALAASTAAAVATAERKSAYDLLYQQFAKYGLQALVTPLEGLIKEGVPASEFAIRLRETYAYQKRFAANKARINKGLAALSEAEYIGLEDQYQNIMRQYGMPETYYARGEMGKQEGFEKLIAGDVSAAELESRVSSAYNRVINANPEVVQSLKSYYPNITNGDILSYVLDPEKALTDINKKITAAEIGGAALGAGLGIDVARAEQLGAFGVTKAQAQQGYQTIAEFLPSATKLGEIYGKQGLGPYNQAVAETEVFGVTGAAEAARKRKQLTQLETAQFSGQTGVGALGRERAGQF